MLLSFRNRKLEKMFNEGAVLERMHGVVRAKKIRTRLASLRAAESLMDFWPPSSGPERCHELTRGKRRGQLSMDLDHPYRLLFVPAHDPVPVTPNGGLDWSRVDAVMIIGIEDTHE